MSIHRNCSNWGDRIREILISSLADRPVSHFSKAGYWAQGDARRLADPRSDTLGAIPSSRAGGASESSPLGERSRFEVRGKATKVLQLLLAELQGINRAEGTAYEPTVQVLNAADYGVPQMRERVFIVAHRDGRPFKFPKPTHVPAIGQRDLLNFDLEPYRTAWDALADVTVSDTEDLAVRGKWADLLPSVPEGSNYLHHTARGCGACLFSDGGGVIGRFF